MDIAINSLVAVARAAGFTKAEQLHPIVQDALRMGGARAFEYHSTLIEEERRTSGFNDDSVDDGVLPRPIAGEETLAWLRRDISTEEALMGTYGVIPLMAGSGASPGPAAPIPGGSPLPSGSTGSPGPSPADPDNDDPPETDIHMSAAQADKWGKALDELRSDVESEAADVKEALDRYREIVTVYERKGSRETLRAAVKAAEPHRKAIGKLVSEPGVVLGKLDAITDSDEITTVIEMDASLWKGPRPGGNVLSAYKSYVTRGLRGRDKALFVSAAHAIEESVLPLFDDDAIFGEDEDASRQKGNFQAWAGALKALVAKDTSPIDDGTISGRRPLINAVASSKSQWEDAMGALDWLRTDAERNVILASLYAFDPLLGRLARGSYDKDKAVAYVKEHGGNDAMLAVGGDDEAVITWIDDEGGQS